MRITLKVSDLSDLKPSDKNSKVHTDNDIQFIQASIERFGFNDPIAVTADGEIIEGHGRYEAAIRLSMEKVPVIVLSDMTDEQIRLYRIAHNKIALSSTFDFARLTDALRDLVGDDIAVNMLGFSDEIADNLLNVVFGQDGDHGLPTSEVVEPFEIIWDTKEQSTQWKAFVKQLRTRYPNMADGDAFLEFIHASRILSDGRVTKTDQEELPETHHEQ